MADETKIRSHRNLGPLAPLKLLRSKPLPGGRRVSGLDDYHGFANKSSTRQPLPPGVLSKLAGLIDDSVSVEAHVDALSNRPDATGRGGIGAGYTYLFQLAAHDIVSTRVPGFADPALPAALRNLRRHPLMLETLFGEGPLACPFAYDTAADGPARLRTGHVGEAPGVWRPPSRDLPRVAFDPTGGDSKDNGLETVLIADPRNDDNMLLGQLTALFHGIYNHLVAAIPAARPGNAPSLADEAVEELARHLLIRIYRRILRHDLLARILHPEVYDSYMKRKGSPLGLDSAATDGSASIEFAFAAGRLAHAMVRPEYRMNGKSDIPVRLPEILKTSSRHNPKWLPVPGKYLIDWDLFFPAQSVAAAEQVNWAIRFGPHVSSAMKQAVAAETEVPDDAGVFITGTVFRDLVRESSWRLLTPADLVCIAHSNGSPILLLPALQAYVTSASVYSLTEQARIMDAGFAHLDAFRASGSVPPLLPAERDLVRDHPPLSLFLQFEALANGNGGATLGPLGSVLVAEAMWPAFSPEPWETAAPSLDRLEKAIFGKLVKTMPAFLAALKLEAAALFET